MLNSYSKEVKNFLCEKSWEDFKNEKNFDKAKYFLYGILLFSGEFTFDRIKLKCDNSNILEICAYILIKFFDAKIQITERKVSENNSYAISIDNQLDVKRITDALGYDESDISVYRIKGEISDENLRFFLRGVFVASGNLHSPQKSYHFEFSTSHKHLAQQLKDMLTNSGLSVKMTVRRSYYVIYCKDSESIEDILMMLGAENFAYDIINTRIEKEIINNINRVNNFESANINKTIDAATIVLSAISYLREQGVFESLLSEQLKETARIREENPEMSLMELCNMFDGKISKSGLNHRLNKIISIAREYSDNTLFV
ncbi:MAG: DNA-binding protein WhiA [Clostridia bacterium]|nr:DNA-binding protein WhiA [Clostridia bacterium]